MKLQLYVLRTISTRILVAAIILMSILQMLDLIHPMYQLTAAYGHFGRKPHKISYKDAKGKTQTATAFSWEKTDRADALCADAKIK